MGAMTLPWVSTTRPPKTSIMNMIGNSQYFFRTRMNRQSSERNDIDVPLKLIVDAFGRGSRRISDQPVSCGLRVAPQIEKVLSHPAEHNGNRCDHQEKKPAQHDRGDDLAQYQAKPGPGSIEGRQQRRAKQPDDNEAHRDQGVQRPRARFMPKTL